MKLINEKKFFKRIDNLEYFDIDSRALIKGALLYAIKDIIDESQHPSGMDRHDIDVRNKLRESMRNG